MDSKLLNVFQHQVALQCSFLILASEDLAAAMKEPPGRSKIEQVFYAIQNLLNAGPHIS
jgi:hypothetical protein